MGLDCYLEKMPRYKKATAQDVNKVNSYLRYLESCERENSQARNYTMKDWCGVDQSEIDADMLMFYKPFFIKSSYGFSSIMQEVAYWRKANAIHNYFVVAVQDGEDDCDYHNEVTEEVLENLLDACEQIMEAKGKKKCSKADELLPTQCGFFFGSTDYDEWYYNDISYTIDIVKKILNETDFEKEMIYYISSW